MCRETVNSQSTQLLSYTATQQIYVAVPRQGSISAASLLGCTMCKLPGGVAGDENGVAQMRTRVAYVHRRGRRHQLPTYKNWGDARARAGTLYGPTHAGTIPCKHRSAKQHRCRRSLAKKHNLLRPGSRPVCPCAQTGTAIAGAIPCNHRSYMSVA